MFEKLFSQIKGDAVEIMKKQPAISESNAEPAANEAIAAISEEVDSLFNTGDFSQLAAFKGENGPENNPVLDHIKLALAQKLQAKGFAEASTASSISEEVVPALFARLKSQFDNGSFDVKSLMSSLSLSDMMKLMGNMGKLKEVFGK